MNIQKTRLSILVSSLIMLGGMTTHVSASTDLNAEVEQLRAEVKALKELVQQQSQLHQQQVQTTNQLAKQQQDTTQHIQQATSVKNTLTTASGSEFKFYGNVRADVSYQAEGGGSVAHPYNQINTVPLEGTAENSDQFKSTLSATRFGFDFRTPVGEDSVSGKVEADFLGSNGSGRLETLRIRHAYLNYGNWLVGQTWSNFAVPDYMPETVDALAYVGGAVKRTPQARYQVNLQPSTKLFIAVEDPKDTLAAIKQRLPALTTRLNHTFADNAGVVSVRGMVHEKKTTKDETTAWGVGAGVKYNLTPQTTLKADYYHVNGDSSFVSWANAGIVETADNKIAAENEFDSITVGLTQQFNPQWRGTLGYGFMRSDVGEDYTKSSTVNKELWQAWANVFYSPTKPISLGVEYVYGEREAYVPATPNGSKTGEDNRVNAVAIYNF